MNRVSLAAVLTCFIVGAFTGPFSLYLQVKEARRRIVDLDIELHRARAELVAAQSDNHRREQLLKTCAFTADAAIAGWERCAGVQVR